MTALKPALYALGIAFVVVSASGFAYRAFLMLRKSAPTFPDGWCASLLGFSLATAIVVGALVLAWRLINREDSRWGSALALLVVLLFLAFVWPTRWTYREYSCQVVQINRFTGHEGPLPRISLCPPD